MSLPENVASMVKDLAAVNRRVAYLEEETTKLAQAQADRDVIRTKLVTVLESAGIPEEAVDLLLAAHNVG